MKKLLIISFLLCGIILSGCSQQRWSSQDNLFEKGKECSKYKDKIQEEIIKDSYWIWNDKLDIIFYSPIRNSCIYTVKGSSYPYFGEYIKDSFTNEKLGDWGRVSLESCDATFKNDTEGLDKCKQDNINSQKEIKQKIKELKWE